MTVAVTFSLVPFYKSQSLKGNLPSVCTAGLGVAIIEAASIVKVRAIKDSVHSLRFIAFSRARHLVVAISSTRGDEHAVCLLAIECHRCAISGSKVIITIGFRPLECTTRCLRKIIVAARLIVNDGDETCCAGAKLVLESSVGNTASGQGHNLCSGIVRAALHLVERSRISAI
jgi:hypothetical protein